MARYLGRHGTGRVAKAALISAITPLMLKTDKNPGLARPSTVFDELRAHSRPTARNSTKTSPCRFTATTGRERKFLKASGSTGGCKECWAA